MDKESGQEKTGCDHKLTCQNEILKSFWINFLRGTALKLVLRIITERSIQSLMKQYSDIPKFGVVVGLFSSLYKLTRCLLNKYFPDMNVALKTYISGMVSSLALLIASPGEQSILKLLIYPRAFECLFQLMCEKGYIKKFKHGDILFYAIQVIAVTYNYILEPPNLPRGFNRTIDQYSQLNYGEHVTLLASRARLRADLNRKYGQTN
ncbi:UNKNOWN [Stylonychia lemnae]|uniref:Transmembrane protein 135 N-terminal domain-containing protein n=1 Tax=Stylonychia lemnae TaxID=5949 RepID=A0A078ARS3_STYLE|nr:UNKNOWN [Stylonychia lemnae]|eukprot:CDW83573.1 UNKNOWN [Stylonychia lemnae]